MSDHKHEWGLIADTRNLRTGLAMAVCKCGQVGWQLEVPVETPEQVEAYLQDRA